MFASFVNNCFYENELRVLRVVCDVTGGDSHEVADIVIVSRYSAVHCGDVFSVSHTGLNL